MSIQSFDGNTFVAFLDICGFKELMNTPGEAERALDRFYQSVFEEVQGPHERTQRIDCIAVSDCAVAFARMNEFRQNRLQRSRNNIHSMDAERLDSMLIFIKNVARKMVQNRVLLKGSIAYGRFEFENRIEIPGIDKAVFAGSAYLDAYRDVEQGRPKLEVGEIRIRPRTKVDEIREQNLQKLGEIRLLDLSKGDYYFYWMLESIQVKNDFERELRDGYRRRYEGIISVIRKYAEMHSRH